MLLSQLVSWVTSCLTGQSIVTGKLGDAPVTTCNPTDVRYEACFNTTSGIIGSFDFVAGPAGNGVSVSISLQGLPDQGGPFMYHIHERPVPADGNCAGTLAHLDPYLRGTVPLADPEYPQAAQVGDLSGKHGNITTTCFDDCYVDDYLSIVEGTPAYIGNVSVVIHLANNDRIACSNITRIC